MDDTRTLFVGNLGPEVTEALLRELFLQAGPIETVRLTVINGTPKPFAHIVYYHESSVHYATEIFKGTKLHRRELMLQQNNAGRDAGPSHYTSSRVNNPRDERNNFPPRGNNPRDGRNDFPPRGDYYRDERNENPSRGNHYRNENPKRGNHYRNEAPSPRGNYHSWEERNDYPSRGYQYRDDRDGRSHGNHREDRNERPRGHHHRDRDNRSERSSHSYH